MCDTAGQAVLKRTRKLAREYAAECNVHHMTPTSIGGCNGRHNLLILRVSRHDALHQMFRNRSMTSIATLLTELTQRSHWKGWCKYKTYTPGCAEWRELFGNKTPLEAAHLLQRVVRLKHSLQASD